VVLGVYLDSYLFVISTTILQIGIGLQHNRATCEYHPYHSYDFLIFVRAAIFMCIFFYCSSKVSIPSCVFDWSLKVIIYLFLIERVHIVRGGSKLRKRDKLYLIHLGGLAPYCVIVILAIIFRLSQLNSSGRCYIGLKRGSSFPLLIYDLFINVPSPLFCREAELRRFI
jgi:hypothetical protein